MKTRNKPFYRVVAGATLSILCAQSIGLSALAGPAVAMTAPEQIHIGPKAAESAEKKAPDAPLKVEVSESEAADSDAISRAKSDSTAPDKSTSEKKDATASAGEDASAPSQQSSDAATANLTIDDVKIEGNRLVETDDIMKVVKTKRGDKFDREQVAQDLRAINGLGYFDDRSLRVVPQMCTNGGVLLKIRVQENAPVSQFSFQGNHVLGTEEIHRIFADQLEKPQNLNQLTAAIDKVESAYHEKGFVLARVTDVKDDPDGSIALTINEGVIDDVQVAGNRKTKDFIVKSAIKTKAGQVYNEKALTNDLRKLYGEGYFQDIRRSLAPSTKDPDKYTLKVEVEEKRTGSVSAGGGVDSVYGPFGTLGFSDGNFRGRGQLLSFQSQVGSGMFGNATNQLNNGGNSFVSNQRTYQVQADWVEPHLKGTNTSLGVSAFGRNMNSFLIDQSQQRTIGASVNLSHPVTSKLTANLGIGLEDTLLKNVADYVSTGQLIDNMATRAIQQGYVSANNIAGAQSFATGVRNNMMKGGAYVSVNPSLTYDTRDDKLSPTRGMLARVTASPSVGLSGAFMKAGINVSNYHAITKETTLATNLQAGTSAGNLPGFASYNLGGFNGIRGYRQFTDLGLGSNMLMMRAEIRHSLPLPKTDNKIVNSLHKNVKVALFTDWGQVSGSNTYNNLLARNNSAASAGLSLRMNVPMIGSVRIDYGYPLLGTLLGARTPRFTFGFGDKF